MGYLDSAGLARFWDKVKRTLDRRGVPSGGGAGQVLGKASGEDFDTAWVDPPAGGIPSGLIAAWSGAAVPDGWVLCDGANGTPDLQGRALTYIMKR